MCKNSWYSLVQLTEADINYEIRDRINVIMAQGRIPFLFWQTIFRSNNCQGDVGTTCSYLSRSKSSLEEFFKI